MPTLIPGEALRILLVSTAESARDEIGESLARGAGDHRLYWVAQPELAPVRAQDLVPHVVLVDDALGGADANALITQLSSRVPGAAILALIEAGAMNRARQAVLAGARGFVTKPLHTDDLIASLRQVLAQRGSRTQEPEGGGGANGRIIVFCAPKGGTGRTTLAINTAVSLQAIDRRSVILVDADFAAPALDVALNLYQERNISDLLPRLSRLDEDLVSSVLASHVSGVRILLAPPPGDLSTPITLPQVQQVLARLKKMFPWVVVDLGLPLDETAFAFLDGADRIVMTVLPEMVGLRNTRLMLDQLHERGYPNEKLWLVLNRATIPGGISARDIGERLHVQVRYRIPDDQPLATHSVNRGVPMVMSHRRSAVARAIRQLARMLADDLRHEMMPASMGEEAKGGLMGRLRRGFRSANV
ncbi:MAG: AAA family ATPase [Anaerolineae bacterium]|nr:AAA family ATPase [Anaerolineae bacterium]